MANHTSVLANGQDMGWPRHTKFLDFELEMACVLARPLVDATPEEALDAVGGWFVLNDWSARDVQADDARRNVFGPVIKAKTFANSIGCDVLTADALPDWTAATGRVRGDGELGARARRRTRSIRSARCWPTPRRASASTPATSSRPARSRVLRPGARSLDQAGPDRRAGDRRHRHCGQHRQLDRRAGVTP